MSNKNKKAEASNLVVENVVINPLTGSPISDPAIAQVILETQIEDAAKATAELATIVEDIEKMESKSDLKAQLKKAQAEAKEAKAEAKKLSDKIKSMPKDNKNGSDSYSRFDSMFQMFGLGFDCQNTLSLVKKANNLYTHNGGKNNLAESKAVVTRVVKAMVKYGWVIEATIDGDTLYSVAPRFMAPPEESKPEVV